MELQRYLMIIWRRLWLIALGVALAAGTAFIVDQYRTPVYSASTTLLLNPASSNVGSTDYSTLIAVERLARTYTGLLRTPEVLNEVIRQLSLPTTAEQLAKRVQVQLVRDTQLIKLTVEDTSPVLAAAIANKIAEVFKTGNEAQQLERFASVKDGLNTQIQQLEKNIAATETEIYALGAPRSASDAARLSELQTKLTLYSSNYTALQNSLIQSRLAEAQATANSRTSTAQLNALQSDLSVQIQQLEKDISAAQAEINLLRAPLSPAEEGRLTQLQAARALYSSNYINLQSNLAQAKLAEKQALNNVVVAERAQMPIRPVRPRVLGDTLMAGLFGAMLAVGVVFLIEYLDDTLKSLDDVQQATHLAVLGTIGKLEGDSPAQRLITALQPRSPSSEAYRALRTHINSIHDQEPVRSLMVTSSNPTEGKSATVANLAVVLAHSDQRVIAVDCDLRWPTLHEYFDLPNQHGLVTALLDSQSSIEPLLQTTRIPNLRLLSTGPLPPNPAELLGGRRMSDIIEALKQEADVIVVDTPPLLAVTDAAALSHHIDGTLLLVQPGTTRRGALTRALEILGFTNARMLGVVVNRVDMSYTNHYSYHYYDAQGERGAKHKRSRSGELRQSQARSDDAGNSLVAFSSPVQPVTRNVLARAPLSPVPGRSAATNEAGKRMPRIRIVEDPSAVQEATAFFDSAGLTTYSAFEFGLDAPVPARHGTAGGNGQNDMGDALDQVFAAQRIGYTILRTLDRMGFVQSGNGLGPHVVSFSRVTVVGHLVVYEVKAEWLAFSVLDLAKPEVMAQLSDTTRRSIKAFTQGGLTYVVNQNWPSVKPIVGSGTVSGLWAGRIAW